MLKLQFLNSDSSPLPSCYSSMIPVSPEDNAIISIAYKLFKSELSNHKTYFNSDGIDSLSIAKHACPHSMRKISDSTFVITKNRSDLKTKIGFGSYKVAKSAWKITEIAPFELQITPIAIVTDLNTQTKPFIPQLYESLENLNFVECVKKIVHITTKSTMKQFHITEKAICDGHHFGRIKPNFYNYIRVCRDAVSGMIELNRLRLIHGDIKPNNILIFQKTDGLFSYSGKLCDIDSVLAIGKPHTCQTLEFLSPKILQYFIHHFIKNKIAMTPELIHLAYRKSDRTKIEGKISNSTASLGLTLAWMGMLLDEYKIRVPKVISELYWQIVSDLTGGFIEPSGYTNRPPFFIYSISRAAQFIKDNTPIPNPRISLEEAEARLTLLMTPPSPILLEIPDDIPPFELTVSCPPASSKSLGKLQAQIQRIYSIFLLSGGYKKIYFNDANAFVKQTHQAGDLDSHSIRKINPTSFVIEFDRKNKMHTLQSTSIKSNNIWLIEIREPGKLNASYKSLIKDIDSNREYKAWPIESLNGVLDEECVNRHIHASFYDLFKGFHITEKIFCDGNFFVNHQTFFSARQFMQICICIINDQIKLHSNGFVHSNLSTNNIHIFAPTGITGDLTAKTINSPHIIPFGTTSNCSRFEILAPRHRLSTYRNIRLTSDSPSFNDVENRYNSKIHLRDTILNIEDATITTGIVLIHLFLNMTSLQEKIGPENFNKFWSILKDLTGGFGSPEATQTWDAFNEATHLQIGALPIESHVPFIPKITLEEAYVRISALISS